ncbi:MAG TPA: YwqG family protein [Streptosporangiaceae bacterium]|nr:YwqG family protein [Streptosporangiaceae bacterium]
MSDRELVAEIARRHLPADVADRWLQLLRPAAALRHAAPGDRTAGVLGGNPALPDSAEWPFWDGHGPLSFVAAVDCAALAGVPLDIMLPPAGTLLFFYFDGQYDNCEAIVGYWDPQTSAGARTLYVGAGEPVSTRACPEGIRPYERVELTVEAVVTFPGWEHPDLRAAFSSPGEDLRAFLGHPVNDAKFTESLAGRIIGPHHQVGGYADPVQGPVEWEVAMSALANPDPQDPRVPAEQARWTLLAQIDTDGRAGMMWGDCGALYWLSRHEDLNDGRTTETSFTWQCS